MGVTAQAFHPRRASQNGPRTPCCFATIDPLFLAIPKPVTMSVRHAYSCRWRRHRSAWPPGESRAERLAGTSRSAHPAKRRQSYLEPHRGGHRPGRRLPRLRHPISRAQASSRSGEGRRGSAVLRTARLRALPRRRARPHARHHTDIARDPGPESASPRRRRAELARMSEPQPESGWAEDLEQAARTRRPGSARHPHLSRRNRRRAWTRLQLPATFGEQTRSVQAFPLVDGLIRKP